MSRKSTRSGGSSAASAAAAVKRELSSSEEEESDDDESKHKHKKTKTAAEPTVNLRRVRALNDVPLSAQHDAGQGGPVVYWMSRDQRTDDNWALLYAQRKALDAHVPLIVCFNLLTGGYLGATRRMFGFMLRGLDGVRQACAQKGIAFRLLRGDATETVPTYARRVRAQLLVTDFSPLREGRAWRSSVAASLAAGAAATHVPVHEVDAHNITPCWLLSDKQEVGARTLRPKCHRHAIEFLDKFPPLVAHAPPLADDVDDGADDAWTSVDALLVSLASTLPGFDAVPEITFATPGAAAASQALAAFLQPPRLQRYADERNLPFKVGAQSGLSPWLHFGQLSAQRCVLDATAVKRRRAPSPSAKVRASIDSFIEELYVRRELADNYCYYVANGHYDSVLGAAGWAQQTLEQHTQDVRQYTYTRAQLERCATHEDVWNAAQLQMMSTGRMHGYMRMYWCKKLLEWSSTPAQALETAIYFNDRYSVDGRDPNGYVGIMWSLCGVHDMGWTERVIFGKIRYMNYAGLVRKHKKAGIAQYVAAALANWRRAGYPAAANVAFGGAAGAGGAGGLARFLVPASNVKREDKKPSVKKETVKQQVKREGGSGSMGASSGSAKKVKKEE